MKNFQSKQCYAFTLIELLVSTTIILLLILAAVPSYDKVQSKNRVQSGGEVIQNCVSRAKSLALAPETNAGNLISYSATLYARTFTQTSTANPNECIVYENTQTGSAIASTKIDTYKMRNNIRISPFILNSSAVDQFTYTFENQNHGLATREYDVNGNPNPSAELNDFSTEDEKLNCLQIKFFYQTGEILLEKLGTIDSTGVCI